MDGTLHGHLRGRERYRADGSAPGAANTHVRSAT